MSMMPGTGLGGRPAPASDNDIYTVLAAVAFLFVLTAVIYVGVRAATLFGSPIPAGGA